MPRNARLLVSLFCLLTVLVAPGTVMAQGPVTPSHTDPFWLASYWNNTSLSGAPVLQRTEVSIDHDWGNGSPDGSVPSDNFSARWTRYIDVAAGTYRFTAVSDDGIRVWVDSNLVIDRWIVHSAQTYTADVALSSGHHLIIVEYFEANGQAVARLSWGAGSPPISHWRGEYFNNTTLGGDPVMVRDDASVNFNWGNGSPAAGVVYADGFSARWTRTVNLAPGNYHFVMTVDDGGRLWVNEHLLIDGWVVQAAHTYTGDIYLPGGSTSLRMEYFESAGQAVARLSWTGATAGSPGGDVVVDDNSAGFTRGGSATGWHVAGEGYGESLSWTRNNDWRRPNYNWGRWYPDLVAGRYEVYVYIPAHYAGTTAAHYWVSHAGGFTQRIVNQSGYANQWVSLGTYNFRGNSSDYLSLNDVTGEKYVTHTIAYDAAKWVVR